MLRFGKLLFFMSVIALVSFSAGILPGISYASTPELTIGVVMSEKLPQFQKAHEAFIKKLKDEGYGQDKVQVYLQVPNPDPMSWANSVRKFVSVGVDVIVTYGAPATQVAMREAGDIPVVFSYVYSPDEEISGNKNATGVSSHVPVRTLLATLKQLRPYERLAVIHCPDNADSNAQFAEVKELSAKMNFTIVDIEVRNRADVDKNLKDIKNRADSMFICSAVAMDEGNEIIRIARESGLPTAALLSDLAESGAVLSLDASAEEQGLLTAKKVADILGGKAPSDSPMANSRQIDLVLNVQAINSIGMKVPFELLNSATRVIK